MTPLSYETAVKLKKEGFPNSRGWEEADVFEIGKCMVRGDQSEFSLVPTLSELIAACGDEIAGLSAIRNETGKIVAWHAYDWGHEIGDACIDTDCCPEATVGPTPEEAVANLWLSLQGKQG